MKNNLLIVKNLLYYVYTLIIAYSIKKVNRRIGIYENLLQT